MHGNSLTFEVYLGYNYVWNVALFFIHMLRLNDTIVGILLHISIIRHKVQKQYYDKQIQHNLFYVYFVFYIIL